MKSKEQIFKEWSVSPSLGWTDSILHAMEEYASEVRKEMMEFTEWLVTGNDGNFIQSHSDNGVVVFDYWGKSKTTQEVFQYWQTNIKGK